MLAEAAAEAVKWTDQATAWSSLGQLLLLIAAALIALGQYRSSLADARTSRTLDVFKRIEEVGEIIDRTSAHLDYEEDWAAIRADLARAEDDALRLGRERDLFTIANLFSKIARMYDTGLISREMFLDEYDEYVLFVYATVSGVYTAYTQPDYRGLFALARRCRENYVRRNGRYDSLKTPVPDDQATRAALERTKPEP